MPKIISEEEYSKIAELFKQGLKTSAIVEATGIQRSTVLRYLRKCGLPTPKQGKGSNKNEIFLENYGEEICRLYELGTNINKLAKKYHKSNAFISDYLEEEGIIRAMKRKAVDSHEMRRVVLGTEFDMLPRGELCLQS